MAYNKKINKNGIYRQLFGWTVICPIIGDMKFLQNFIDKNNVLRKYFSILPSSSYHVTIHGIWSNFCKLLKQQQNYIDNCITCDEKELLQSMSISPGFFNPGNCLDQLFKDLIKDCKNFEKEYTKTKSTIQLTVKQVYYNGTIGIIFKENDDMKQMDNIRKTVMKTTSRQNHEGLYHMTLAYKYNDTNKEEDIKIKHELDILNMLLTDQTITLDLPVLTSFETMECFKPVKV